MTEVDSRRFDWLAAAAFASGAVVLVFALSSLAATVLSVILTLF